MISFDEFCNWSIKKNLDLDVKQEDDEENKSDISFATPVHSHRHGSDESEGGIDYDLERLN